MLLQIVAQLAKKKKHPIQSELHSVEIACIIDKVLETICNVLHAQCMLEVLLKGIKIHVLGI